MDAVSLIVCAPIAIMLLTAITVNNMRGEMAQRWKLCNEAAGLALLFTLFSGLLVMTQPSASLESFTEIGLSVSPLQAVIAVLVQGLGVVVGCFSCRYLEGEQRQARYIVALSMVLACVQLLLIADHWLTLILAWSGVGVFLKNMLCFYEERPFALLASHKKTVADLMADGLLLLAALFAWVSVGSGSISALLADVSVHGSTQLTNVCAVLLVAAVVLRTALLPVHGWLIQVMEAPTPVSALLHAGVVNLSGYLLIRFSPLFAHSAFANSLLLGIGLVTCVFAALVMFTRISIKVRLAWSTVAQMGFMIVECALGLYTFAALHLIGHSIYKAYAFLSAAEIVSDTRVAQIAGRQTFSVLSFCLAPLLALAIVFGSQALFSVPPWPIWWSLVLALAWAPVLWWSHASDQSLSLRWQGLLSGSVLTAILTLVSVGFHHLPLGTVDQPRGEYAFVVVLNMGALYLFSVLIQVVPQRLHILHRWIYAGLYLDAFYTRCVLRFWPVSWGRSTHAYR
jgi:NAD(P)H-quinone oxidoreductase subunit 5